MELLYLRAHLEALEPYGTVQFIIREMWSCDGLPGWQMKNPDVAFMVKKGVFASHCLISGLFMDIRALSWYQVDLHSV